MNDFLIGLVTISILLACYSLTDQLGGIFYDTLLRPTNSLREPGCLQKFGMGLLMVASVVVVIVAIYYLGGLVRLLLGF